MPGVSFAPVGRSGRSSPPYRHKGTISLCHRYYDPLRLPIVLLASFAGRSLHDTLHTRLLFVSCLSSSHRRIRVYPSVAGSFTSGRYSSTFRIQGDYRRSQACPEPVEGFPSYPGECMPRSQTPGVSLQLRHYAAGIAAFRPLHAVGFPEHLP